jgi:hypothetical protein
MLTIWEVHASMAIVWRCKILYDNRILEQLNSLTVKLSSNLALYFRLYK